MKFLRHTSCIIAILAQIILSSMASSHDLGCQVSSNVSPDIKTSQTSHSDAHNCGCCHHSSYDHQATQQDFTPTKSSVPEPCTCSDRPPVEFIAGDYSIESRTKQIADISNIFLSILSPHSFFTLSSHYIKPSQAQRTDHFVCFEFREKNLQLPEYSGRFVSTHLSKFLL